MLFRFINYNFYRWDGRWGFWIRLGHGVGIHVSNRKRSEAYFSERFGYKKVYYFFGVRFEVLL